MGSQTKQKSNRCRASGTLRGRYWLCWPSSRTQNNKGPVIILSMHWDWVSTASDAPSIKQQSWFGAMLNKTWIKHLVQATRTETHPSSTSPTQLLPEGARGSCVTPVPSQSSALVNVLWGHRLHEPLACPQRQIYCRRGPSNGRQPDSPWHIPETSCSLESRVSRWHKTSSVVPMPHVPDALPSPSFNTWYPLLPLVLPLLVLLQREANTQETMECGAH